MLSGPLAILLVPVLYDPKRFHCLGRIINGAVFGLFCYWLAHEFQLFPSCPRGNFGALVPGP